MKLVEEIFATKWNERNLFSLKSFKMFCQILFKKPREKSSGQKMFLIIKISTFSWDFKIKMFDQANKLLQNFYLIFSKIKRFCLSNETNEKENKI